jgi:brefeldin A-resistance guanine nucleotide exchange factor 1
VCLLLLPRLHLLLKSLLLEAVLAILPKQSKGKSSFTSIAFSFNGKYSRTRYNSPQLSIERGKKSVEHIFQLHQIIPRLSQNKSPSEAWNSYWQPILTSLSQQCCTACREVRQYALTFLQRTILLSEITKYEDEDNMDRQPWVSIFDDVLIPMLSELLRPEVYDLDPLGIDEARMRASALLCKIFLHYCNRMLEMTAFIDIWMEILDILDGSMHTSENDHLVSDITRDCHY